MSRLLVGLFCILLSVAANASPDAARFIQLVDYIAIDYHGAIAEGKVINAAEYGEMREFVATVVEQAHRLELAAAASGIINLAETLQTQVIQKADPKLVAATASTLRQEALRRFKVNTVPRQVPDLHRGQALYSENCSSCHGIDGRGDGMLGATLQPAPTNFHDVARYQERTLYGLYSTISLGVEGTAMQAYAKTLSERDRWSLAFYVGQLGVNPELRKKGAALWTASPAGAIAELATLTTLTPAQVAQRYGPNGEASMAYLRSEPAVIFNQQAPLQFTREHINSSLKNFENGDYKAAYRNALSAYLDGFELVEHSVDTVDPTLRREIETAMTGYREQVRDGSTDTGHVREQARSIIVQLDRAEDLLASRTLSGNTAFVSSFIILLREGLEALLVIAALAAFLIKTGRRDGMLYLHIGWGAALLAGAVTWLASQYLFNFSGASREMTEGIAALVAMAVLFYVGFWLHNKTHAQQWKLFIEGSINKALSSGTLWGLAGLSFIAVYREVFETILFYQAMWVQTDQAGQGFMLSGMGAAAVVLVLLAWVILRYSTRLPLRQFFTFTSVFMFVLAVVFAGKGVAALQEAGKFPVDPVNFPRIDILGIYPSFEGLLLQALLIVTAIVIIFSFGRTRSVSASA